jgi:phosphoserine phosphatase
MKDLIVVDFDKTLIPYDSFRSYIFLWLKKYPFYIGMLLVFRKIGLLSSIELKKSFLKKISKNIDYQKINTLFSQKLVSDIRLDILQEVREKQTPGSCVLLLSASPDSYIKLVGNQLKFSTAGSDFVNGNFQHLHSEGKIYFLKKQYPFTEFNYLYAISDSASDIKLLEMFQNSRLI